jgi:hypothetical protein
MPVDSDQADRLRTKVICSKADGANRCVRSMPFLASSPAFEIWSRRGDAFRISIVRIARTWSGVGGYQAKTASPEPCRSNAMATTPNHISRAGITPRPDRDRLGRSKYARPLRHECVALLATSPESRRRRIRRGPPESRAGCSMPPYGRTLCRNETEQPSRTSKRERQSWRGSSDRCAVQRASRSSVYQDGFCG